MDKPTEKRTFSTVLIVTVILTAITLVGCSRSPVPQKTETNHPEGKLYIYNWSYYTPDSVIQAFEKEYGVDVVLDYFASNEEMFAKLRASKDTGYDLVFPSGDYVSIMKNLGMLEKLDKTRIPNLSHISAKVLEKASYDPDMEYAVPYYMGAAGIAVHTDQVKDYDHSWNIFGDKRLAGKMVMMDDMREVMGDALSYLGYSVNTVDETHLEEAGKLIADQWKPNIVKFDAEGFAKSFASGEYLVAHGYAEGIFEELPETVWDDVDFFLPESGGPMYIDSLCIPKGARNYDTALAFINYIHDPKNYALFLDRFHFPASVNEDAEQYRTTTPFYTVDMLEHYELKENIGAELERYNTIWESIRYVD